MELTYKNTITVTDSGIDEIIGTAFDGGITYWCDEAKVDGEYLGEYASDQISRGGTLRLHDTELNGWHTLTKDKFLTGLTQYLQDARGGHAMADIITDGELDTAQVDAEVADVIIQYALFGEIVYG